MKPAAGLVVLALAAALLLGACGGASGGPDAARDGKVRVVTTLPLFADIVREVGGDRVDVYALLPSGADPHTFEPAPRDVQRVAEADLVFANGLDLEPEALKVIEANADLETVGLLGSSALGTGVIYEGMDPHLWMDPQMAERYVWRVMLDLSRVDPEGADEYATNRDRYLGAIGDAGTYARAATAGVPSGRRNLVTTHDAFGYLARYLGFEIAAVVAPGPGQEARPRRVAGLQQVIEDNNVPAVFAEPQIGSDRRILEEIAADVGVQVCTLYSDSLDGKITSYAGLLRFDADELARCLGGAASG